MADASWAELASLAWHLFFPIHDIKAVAHLSTCPNLYTLLGRSYLEPSRVPSWHTVGPLQTTAMETRRMAVCLRDN